MPVSVPLSLLPISNPPVLPPVYIGNQVREMTMEGTSSPSQPPPIQCPSPILQSWDSLPPVYIGNQVRETDNGGHLFQGSPSEQTSPPPPTTTPPPAIPISVLSSKDSGMPKEIWLTDNATTNSRASDKAQRPRPTDLQGHKDHSNTSPPSRHF